MPAAAQNVRQAGRRTGLARPCRHNQQVPAKPFHNLPANGTDCGFLVITVRNLIGNRESKQVFPPFAPVHEFLQVILAERAADLPLRATQIVPEIRFKAVAGKHHRPAPKFPFQAVRI